MDENRLSSHIGCLVTPPGHFEFPVVLEDARPLGSNDLTCFECCIRLPDGSLEEAVISTDEVAAILGKGEIEAEFVIPVDAEKLRLLVESTRIHLAYAHDQQFAVSLSGSALSLYVFTIL